MQNGHNPKRRLSVQSETETTFTPKIQNTPALPAIDWSHVGQQAPKLLQTPVDNLPRANSVIITWAESEWAAMEHVFCASGSSMPYSARNTGSWSGWQRYDKNLPQGHPSDWTYWGSYRLVEVAGNGVLLFKSNTHLDWPGATYLEALIQTIIKEVGPKLILSIGTAGGARTQDHVGTVRVVSAGTYDNGPSPSSWPVYSNRWKAPSNMLQHSGFSKLLFPVPTTSADLQGISSQFNHYYSTKYSLSEFDPDGLNMGDSRPQIDNQTGGSASLLTTSTFVVGTTKGNYQHYTCIEMDDAVIGKECLQHGTAFGFVRNVSDPVQNAVLPAKTQGDWGSAIYDTYGLYTSYNGALAAWAVLI
jgi:nucleoside phosphorylase